MYMLDDFKHLKENLERDIAAKQIALDHTKAEYNAVLSNIERLEKEQTKDLGSIVQTITESLTNGSLDNHPARSAIEDLTTRAMHAHTHIKEIVRLIEVSKQSTDGDVRLHLLKTIDNEIMLMKSKKCF